ncbi:methanogenesis marker 16 metalloprotein [Methanomethylophilus alvi]|uniref:methanogenesis marker 16 metalloprotein n=1 Tax=Methanomethylophilus alvi TaxID=1291540 RepID=UPI0037DC342A
MIGDSLESVQKKIDSRRAKVYTASEFKDMVRRRDPSSREADVVTCGTFGVMSGTMAILCVPVAEAGTFKRADTITLNGVPATVGPCPNESLGLVDCVVYGTSRRDGSYGGGHLFRDMVAGKSIEVEVSAEGRTYRAERTLSEIPFARMVLTRGCFKNYTCFANFSDEDYATIFSGPRPLRRSFGEASVSGCGEINPVQNDPELLYLRPGASALLNGAPAMILGCGTRSSPEKPNLSIEADMHQMRPELMGGFRTSEGPECLTSVASAIPITSEKGLEGVSVLDEDVYLPVADVRDRKPLFREDYASVWKGTDHRVSIDPAKCLGCRECQADLSCPRDAKPSALRRNDLCMDCGLCTYTCVGGVFGAVMGSVSFDGRTVPIGVRQSSRSAAEDLCVELKGMVENGNWKLRDVNGKI